MKVVFTGGGTGGHFYPLIAVAEELNKIIDEKNIANVRLYYFSDEEFDKKALFENGITFKQISAGKRRIYSSSKNFFDLFKIGIGVIQAIFKLFAVFPDVVFAKGGYASFPTLFAARILRIPTIIHESDSAPGRVNVWASKFATKIALSYKEAMEYFPKIKEERFAHTGQPVRLAIRRPVKQGAFEFLHLEEDVPIIFIQGGSQGASIINNVIERALPKLLEKYQIIHQVGDKNIEKYKKLTDSILKDNTLKYRYKQFPFLNVLAMKMIAGVADLTISRAGSSIFEIASWGIPSIIIPITHTNGDHQRKNAFNYSRAGACIVMLEKNFKPNLLISEIARILDNEKINKKMSESAKKFFKEDAGENIALEMVRISLKHEK